MIAQLLKSLLKQKSAVEKRSFQNTNTALERERNEVNNDNKQDTLDKKYGRIMEDAKGEYLTPRLMEKYDVNRAHAMSELESHHGDMDKAGKVCMEHAESARDDLILTLSFQQGTLRVRQMSRHTLRSFPSWGSISI